MSAGEIIGAAMIVLLFSALIGYISKDIGKREAFAMVAFVFGVVAYVAVASYLLSGGTL